jgi:hypothetical protein
LSLAKGSAGRILEGLPLLLRQRSVARQQGEHQQCQQDHLDHWAHHVIVARRGAPGCRLERAPPQL